MERILKPDARVLWGIGQDERVQIIQWLRDEIECELARPATQISSQNIDDYINLLYELEQISMPAYSTKEGLNLARKICIKHPTKANRWFFPQIVLARAACIGIMILGVICKIHCSGHSASLFAALLPTACGNMLHFG